jgi:hypothetical protein
MNVHHTQMYTGWLNGLGGHHLFARRDLNAAGRDLAALDLDLDRLPL